MIKFTRLACVTETMAATVAANVITLIDCDSTDITNSKYV